MGGPPYASVVEELVKLLEENDQYNNLQKAIDQALSYDIVEIKKLGIIDRDSFLDDMDFLVTTWIPSEDLKGKDVYYRLVVFYIIFDQPALQDLQSPNEPASAHKPLSWLSKGEPTRPGKLTNIPIPENILRLPRIQPERLHRPPWRLENLQRLLRPQHKARLPPHRRSLRLLRHREPCRLNIRWLLGRESLLASQHQEHRMEHP